MLQSVVILSSSLLSSQAMNQFTASENLLSDLSSGRLVALTAPLAIDQDVLIGYAVSSEEAYCATLPLDEFIR
jgi:hypothetical protein